MMIRVIVIIIGLVGPCFGLSIPQSFRECISASGTGPICILPTHNPGDFYVINHSDQNPLSPDNKLVIGRSNIKITALIIASPFEAVIKRKGPSREPLLYAADGVRNIEIENLVFDGNRVEEQQCSIEGMELIDVDLRKADSATIRQSWFLYSRFFSLAVGFNAAVAGNIFGYGRIAGVWGAPAESIADFFVGNFFFGFGTGGLEIKDSSWAVTNILLSNHREFSYATVGGQLVTSSSSGAVLASNVVDGGFASALENGTVLVLPEVPLECPVRNGGPNPYPYSTSGIELEAPSDVILVRNEVKNHGQASIGVRNATGFLLYALV